MENFIGKDGFIWFQGVVEDHNDPLMLGRCRVRCLGWHTDDKSLIKTEDLPWAFPMQPITSAAVSGMGSSPTGLVPGSWVILVVFLKRKQTLKQDLMTQELPQI